MNRRNQVEPGSCFGQESETQVYMTELQRRFEEAGIVEPVYVPIDQGGKVSNVTNAVLNMYGDISLSVQGVNVPLPDDVFRNAPVNTIVGASNDEGGQRNIVGYSYGSVMGAHAALDLANQGIYVDNVGLVGSPVSDDSPLYNELINNPNIGNVVRYDIENDPLSNGVNLEYFAPTENPENNVFVNIYDGVIQGRDTHFYYINNDQNQQDNLANDIANEFNGSQ